jgi:tRNA nucleotidyltransferase/poly(A) polymerase
MIMHPTASEMPEFLHRFASFFENAGYQCLLVGGSIRAAALGRPVKDFDIATDARPETVRKLFRRTIPTGIQHGTVTVLFAGHSLEVTTFRAESDYSDGRHPDTVEFGVSLEADLSRRDFTVNAMALDLRTGDFVDPHGGLEDLRNGVVRTVGAPEQRFREDGLRLLRAVRFCSTLGFRLEGNTFEGMKATHTALVGVSAERVREELLKSLTAPSAVSVMETLEHTLLREHVFFLDADRCSDLYTAGERTGGVDLVSSEYPIVRLAALIALSGASDAVQEGRRLAKALKLSNRDRDSVLQLLALEGVSEHALENEASVRDILSRFDPELVRELAMFTSAVTEPHDSGRAARIESRFRNVLATQPPLQVSDLAIGGEDLKQELAIPPGREIGILLRALLQHVIQHPGDNTREILLKHAEELRSRDQGHSVR